ncbi:DUF2062 domain-containing protein [Prochlorococcus sp. MIT 1223]|uniref:DUF2062 domain-containing protein n=1 Tax=Prochlorococcus sp. MIT 1223 TaxID=3096217 RepID=UPI002A75935A|nr:DUF2062 domain-containing protein [Prochlorococcus sp. MIT 1223]
MIQILINLFKRSRRFLFWIWSQDGTSAERARGIGIGVFCGCFPFFGLQTGLSVILASLFKSNRLLAVVGTWISNPFTYIPLYWFNYKIGSIFLQNANYWTDFRGFTLQDIWEQGWVLSSTLLLGSTVVGITFGLLIGFIMYVLLKDFPIGKRLH